MKECIDQTEKGFFTVKAEMFLRYPSTIMPQNWLLSSSTKKRREFTYDHKKERRPMIPSLR